MVELYGEEVALKSNKAKGKSLTIEHYLQQGFSIENAKKAISARQNTSSLDKFIGRYGKEEGLARYTSANLKKTIKLQGNKYSVSKGEKDLVSTLIVDYYMGDIENIFSYQTRRLSLSLPNGKSLYPDFIDNKRKVVIEYNGDFWHMNPLIFSSDYYNQLTKCTAKELWSKDKEKRDYLESIGYRVIVVWESEYSKNKKIVIEDIKRILDENSKN